MKFKSRLSSILVAIAGITFQFNSVFAIEESFILINGITDQVIEEFGPNINTEFSPCSTFKIPLSLMGYDVSILQDETNPIWDFREGYDDFLPLWRVPQSPLSWMQYSCVWYSRILSQELGLEKIKRYLVAMDYGNQDVSGALLETKGSNPFWINSTIKISPKQQVEFLTKMIRGDLQISKQAIQMTRSILFKEDLLNGWKLFGKTGWSGSDVTHDGKTLEHSWFVGWMENKDIFYTFAYLIRDNKINLDQRIPRVKQLIFQYNIELCQ